MKYFFTYLALMISGLVFSQKSLEKLLEKHNKENIPYITVNELFSENDSIVLLDTREENEFRVSHIKNAIHVGYNFFNLDTIKQKIPDKNTTMVVYCSLGIRSEIIAQKLNELGYKNIRNLFGGIFEWKNNNLPIYDYQEKETDSIHAFSKEWSKWLKKGEKVYE